MTMNISIKRKIIYISICLGVVPMIFISWLFISTFNSFSKKTVSNSYKELEEQAYKNIQYNIRNEIDFITPVLKHAENQTVRFASSSIISKLSTIEERQSKIAFDEARDIVNGIIKNCSIQYKLMAEKLKLGLYSAEFIIENKGRIFQSMHFPKEWKCKNQITGEVVNLQLPSFYVGLKPIEKIFSYEENYSSIVDDVQEMTGVNCSLFQIMNEQGDMLRIATNVRAKNGQRGIETYIPAKMPDGKPNPVIAAVMDSGVYKGLAIEVEEEFFSIYKAIHNDSGKLIGAFFAGVPTNDPFLNASIIKTKSRSYGFTFVVNSKGKIIIHQNNKFIGKSIDHKIFQLISQSKTVDKTTIPVYLNSDKSIFYACKHYPPRDWYICVSGNLSQIFNDENNRVRNLLKAEIKNVYNAAELTIQEKKLNIINRMDYISVNGDVVLSLKNGDFIEISENLSEQKWFREGLLQKNMQLSNSTVIKSNDFKNDEVRITCPVYFHGQSIGLVALYFDWNLIHMVLKGHIIGNSGYSFIVDKNGLIVSHPEYQLSDQKNLCDSSFGELSTIAKQKILMGKTGHDRYYLNNMEYYIYYTPIKALNNMFYLAATELVDDFLAMANRIKKDSENEYKEFMKRIISSLIFWTIISIVIGFFVSRSISVPVEKLMNFASDVSQGDLSKTLKSKNNDEIGFLLTSINNMVVTYRKIVVEIISYARLLNVSSQNLVGTSNELTKSFEKITSNASDATETSVNMSNAINDISLKIEDMSNNIKDILKMTETMSNNTLTVSDAIKKMSDSMNEIGQYASQGTALTTKAVEMTYNTGDTMTKLSKAAEDIGGVTNLIKRLAYKTNLIAINASIEASTAGEAGMGFVVIAKNIQSFAEQSNNAAENISKHISSVQEIVSKTIEEITRTSTIIREINSSSAHITSLVNEQIAVSDEIVSTASSANEAAKNVVESIDSLSQGSETISTNSNNIAKGSAEVSENIKNVSAASLFSLDKFKEISQSAFELDQFSKDLKQIVSNLKTE